MAKAKKNLNSKSSEYLEQNVFKENPEGLPEVSGPEDKAGLVKATNIPEMRRIIFVNGRDPGHELMFHYHTATHPLKHYTLYHGKEYDLPVEVIEHLEHCAEKQYGYRKGPSGHPEMYVKGLRYLFSCKPVRSNAA